MDKINWIIYTLMCPTVTLMELKKTAQVVVKFSRCMDVIVYRRVLHYIRFFLTNIPGLELILSIEVREWSWTKHSIINRTSKLVVRNFFGTYERKQTLNYNKNWVNIIKYQGIQLVLSNKLMYIDQ